MSGWPHSECRRRRLAALVLAGAVSLCGVAANAHKASDAYLSVDSGGGRSSLRWDIALRDLDAALQLDSDGDRQIRWAEVRMAWPRVDALALASLSIEACRFEVNGHALEQRSDGAYAVLQLAAACDVQANSAIGYHLFAEQDPTHRGILVLRRADGAQPPRLLVPQPVAAAAAGSPPAANAHAPASFIREGVHHLLTGYDHLLFLLCLLLPAVLQRAAGGWRPVHGWRQALGPVAATVTLFTLAHSTTLALAALGWVRLSPSWVEPAIAVTIMLAAIDNIRPLMWRYRQALTFGFGLIHGFGFAGVLAEMALPQGDFAWALLQFNLGLEAGQLALVLLVVPLLYVLRQRRMYVQFVLRTGSLASLLLAAIWCVERTAGLRLLAI